MKALFSTLISVLFIAHMALGQTITTDKHDYPPGSTVIISGTGFQANESVQLQVLHILADGNNSTEPQHQPWTVTADGSGNVSSTWLLDVDALGATFKLMADGLSSGRHAETTFTDANVNFVATGLPTSASTNVTYSTTSPSVTNAVLTLNNANSFNSSTVLNKNADINYSFTNPVTVAGIQYTCPNSIGGFNQGNGNSNTTVTCAYAASCTAPTITTQPSAATITYGANTTFAVGASGTGPLSYQWMENGTNIINGGVYSGATTATLTLTKPGVSLSGKIYTCLVTNACGNITSNNGVLTVNARPITITADAKTKIYGSTDPTLTAQVTGGTIVSGDVTSGALSRVAGENVGTYAINKGTFTYGSNYAETYVAGTLTVTKAALTITANNQTKVYGAALPALTVSYTGLVNGDVATATPATASTIATASSAVGTYLITASAVDVNYTITYVAGTLTVTKAVLTITAVNKSKVYGAALPALTVTYTGLVNGDVATATPATASTTATGSSPVGAYPITASAIDANYMISYVAGTLTVTPVALTITADNKSKAYGIALPALTVSYTGLVNGDVVTATPATASTAATAASPIGMYPITASGAIDANYTITYVVGTLTIIQATTTTTLITSAASVRYMDPLTMTAKITPLNTATALTGTVQFSVGSHLYGSPVPVVAVGDGLGTVQATLIPQISDLPGNYTVTAVFTSTNTNYSGGSGTKPLTVIPRNASPLSADGFYTGTLFAWTTGTNTSTGTVTLSAVLKDNNSPTGDLRGAKVTFYLVNGTTLTPISSAQNLPVGLVDINDGSVGTASAIVQLNIGANNAQSFHIAVGITGAYTNNPWNALSQCIVTVSKPIVGGFICGGGKISNSSSNGYIKGASTLNTGFEFDIQYNNSGTNPKGKVTILVKSNNKVDGTLDANLHSYIITTNAIALLNVGLPMATGTFSAKANLVEQLLDGTVVAIEGGATFQMEVFQNGCNQQIAITLNRKAGGIWYSSNWNSVKTVLQGISGGTVSVSGGGICPIQPSPLMVNNSNNNAPLATILEPSALQEVSLNPTILTTPSHTSDVLTVYVNEFNDGVATVRMYDLTQRLRGEWKFDVHNNIGQIELNLSNLIAGAYIIVVDDKNKQQRKTQKVVRIN